VKLTESNLTSALTGSFVIVNLGAGGDSDYNLPLPFLKTITLVEADGGTQRIDTSNRYHEKYTVRDIVAGNKIQRCFTLRKYWGCSSIYEPRQELIKQYGLEEYFEEEAHEDVVPTTIPEILSNHSLESIDYLKTDLEGVDFEVIKSCEGIMGRILALKCELRFQPFFHGEPFFHEVAEYLHRFDFELIGLKPAYWKPVTAHVKNHHDGRVAFVDCLFFKRPEAVRLFSKDVLPLAAAKQVIIAAMSGKKSYAEWLLEQYRDLIPKQWQGEMVSLVTPHPLSRKIEKRTRPFSVLRAKVIRGLRKITSKQVRQKRFNHSYAVPGDE
jgi:hypothetical protein